MQRSDDDREAIVDETAGMLAGHPDWPAWLEDVRGLGTTERLRSLGVVKPTAEVQDLLDRFLAAARMCGPFELKHERDELVVLRGSRRIFASARPTRNGLRGHLNLTRAIDDPRFRKVESLTRRLFFHRFVVFTAAELDDRFLGWLREAYEVGQGAGRDGPTGS